MIVTLTPNPSLDRTLQLQTLVRGGVNRAEGGRVDPGGKGVNVSRALAQNGVKTVAVLPLGGPDGAVLAELLARQGVAVRRVPVAGDTRTNITVAEPDGTTTKLNEPGPDLTAAEVDDLAAAVLDVAAPGSWVVACGSVPGGVDHDFYARLIGPLHARGARVAVDSSGAALRAVLSGGPDGSYPDLIKPNREELAEAVGHPLGTLGDVVEAAAELVARGVGTVLASLGADGAVLVTGSGARYGSSRVEHPRSTVGAGDALLAGYLSQVAQSLAAGSDGDPTHRSATVPAATIPAATIPAATIPAATVPAATALSAALAWGAAATGLPGSRMPRPADVAAVTVTLHDLDPARPLEGDH
jgi:1-phosphofructokinase